MSIPSIPKGLQPIVSGYSYGAPDGVMRTEVAGGAPRYALEFDRGVQRFDVTLLLIGIQFTIWNVFFHRSIDKGAISFTMPLDSGFGLSAHTVNIIPGTYSVANINPNATASVAFSVEAESQAYLLDDDGAAALLDLYETYGPQTGAFFDRLSKFANNDTLVLNQIHL